MDPRRFLGRSQRLVLPVVDRAHAEGRERPHHLEAEVEPGWWSIELMGRRARAIAPADAPPMESLARRTGATCASLLFVSGTEALPLQLAPAGELPAFSPAGSPGACCSPGRCGVAGLHMASAQPGPTFDQGTSASVPSTP